MAQVIKYKSGGSTSRKYGTFTYDNNVIQVDDNFINQISEYGKTLDNKTGNQFNNIIQALKDGEDIRFDSSGDGILYGNVQFDTTVKQSERMKNPRSGFGRRAGSLWRGREQSSREAINALKGFKYTEPESKKTIQDWSKEIKMEYSRDKNGKYIVTNGKRTYINGANNSLALSRLNSLEDILKYTDNDTFKGFNGLDKQAYITWFNNLGKDGIESLKNNLRNGTWTEEDRMALDDIGIILGPEVDNSAKTQTAERTQQELLAERGITSPESNKYINVDENGNLIITDLFNETFGDKNAIYNDWWQQSMQNTGTWNPDFSFLNGYTRIGNRLYKTSDLLDENSELYKFARQKGGFYDLNAANKFKDANSILEYLWGRTDDSSTFDRNNFYSSWFYSQDPNLRYRSLNGTRELPNGQQLIEYWNNDTKDEFGRPTDYKYALLDNQGNLIQDNVNINDFNIIENGQQLGLNTLQRINLANSPYHGRYIINFSDNNGNIGDYELYVDPNNKNDIILKSKELNNWNASKGKNIRIPVELAQAINSNPNFWNKLMSDKTLQNRFIRSLVEGVRSQTGDALTTINPFSTSTLEISDLEKLGFDNSTAIKIYNYLENNYGDRNEEGLSERRNKYLVDPYQPNIPINQKGGVIGTTKDASGVNEKKHIDLYNDTTKTAGVKDKYNLSHSDKLQIASIAGDVASLIAAIPTGGNPIAGTLGYGSSLTQFGADVSRDGFQGKDLVSLMINAGLDTISLLPGIGITGKIGKLVKAVNKSAHILKPALLLAGATNAVSAVNNIANGKGTLDDWKSLSEGLFAIKGIKNSIQDIKATEYKGKPTTKSVKTKEDFKKEYVDKVVAEKGLSKLDTDKQWTNSDGTIKDYDKAIDVLSKSGDLKITKAQEALWTANELKEKGKSNISNIFSGSYNPFSKNYRFKMSNRRLPKDFDLTSLSGNTSRLRTIERLTRYNPEIVSELQSQGWIIPRPFRFTSDYGGNWFYRNPVFRRFTRFKSPLMLPESTGLEYTTNPEIKPTEIINMDPYVQSVDDYIGLRFHKKGGKIIKAQNGAEVKKTHFTPILNNSILSDELLQLKGVQPLDPSKNDDLNYTFEDNGSYGISREVKNRFINPDMLLGIGDLVASTISINRSNKKMKDAIREGMIGSQQKMPEEYYSRFSDNGINRMYNNRIDAMRQYQNNTSDPNQAIAERLTRDMAIDQMENERDTKFSQMIDQYNDKLLAQKQQYSNIRTDIDNKNRNSWYQGLAQMDMAEANRITQQTQNIKNFIYQLRNDFAKDLQTRTAVEDKLNTINAETKYQNDLKRLFLNAGGFDGMSEKEKETWGNDWVGYITYKFPDQVSNLRTKNLFNVYKSAANDSKRRHSPFNYFGDINIPMYQNNSVSTSSEPTVVYHKRGGQIKRFRNVSEQSYLDQNKATNKAVNDLNNNIIKLFIKMMS